LLPRVRNAVAWLNQNKGLNLRQDLFDASERSAAGGDSNPFGNGAPTQWAGPKGRLPPQPS
ncbi:MAG: hypothetical protein VYC97_10110, partial [SAR324 cluster bacterium]|nr:hypothetical protein [SAR324 cluster bacterium]